MANAYQDFGITDNGDSVGISDLILDDKNILSMPIIVESGQGKLPRGSIMGLDETGKYILYDGSDVTAWQGFLNEEIDTADGDVHTSLYWNATLDGPSTFTGGCTITTALSPGWYKDALILIKEAK